MKNVIIILSIILICLAIGYGIGFYQGSATKDESTVTKYISGQAILGTADSSKFELIKEEKPVSKNSLHTDNGIYKPSKELYYSPDKVIDTAAIIAEYEARRTYKAMVFDSDTLGKLEVFPVIQHNSLYGLDYNFTPVYREKIITRTKVFQQFASVSYSTLNYVNVGGGIFYHNLGFEYQYQINLGYQNNGHLFGVKYKF